METTKVLVTDLLAKLVENRALHEATYQKDKAIWVKKCTKALSKAADKAVNNGEIDANPTAKFPKPRHFLKSYDAVIARLHMETEKTVELTEREFASYVQDDWQWRDQFMASSYSNMR